VVGPAEFELTDLRKASSSTGPPLARARAGSAAGFGTNRGAEAATGIAGGAGLTGSTGSDAFAAAETSGVGSGRRSMLGAAVAAASAEGAASGAADGVETSVGPLRAGSGRGDGPLTET
jgi:hypothetical protein